MRECLLRTDVEEAQMFSFSHIHTSGMTPRLCLFVTGIRWVS